MPTTTPSELKGLTWPASRLVKALEGLGKKSGMLPKTFHSTGSPDFPKNLLAPETKNLPRLGHWLNGVASLMELEVAQVAIVYPELGEGLKKLSPAILKLPDALAPDGQFLALLGGSSRKLRLLAPDGKIHKVPFELVRAVLCHTIEAPHRNEVNLFLEKIAIPKTSQPRVASQLLAERLRSTEFREGWQLKLSPGASFWKQLWQGRVPHYMLAMLAANFLFYVLFLLSWGVISNGIFEGRHDPGWLLLWLLLLFAMVPFRVLTTWFQGPVAVKLGKLLKRRMLYGALRMDSEKVRRQGIGKLFGYVVESQAVEALMLSGGLLGIVAVVQLIVIIPVLLLGAGGWFALLSFLTWIGFAFFLGYRYWRQRQRWTAIRLEMTDELIEGMIGHRTRLAQQLKDQWHTREDQLLATYLELSSSLDRLNTLLTALIPRGWIVLGIVGLIPAFVNEPGASAAIALGLGGVLFGYNPIYFLAQGLPDLAGALIAWKQIAPVFRAGSHLRNGQSSAPDPAITDLSGDLTTNYTNTSKSESSTLVEAHHLHFRYYDKGTPVLEDCSLRIYSGDRILLQGPSGGGKSTLASLLAGWRKPESGVLFLHGYDRQTLGFDNWRKGIVAAPQFHENHVLTGTFAFNLLMSRQWPPRLQDLKDAEEICYELSLGELLRTMPAGLQQMLGDSGWQLSHGERSRLYIARALLQGAELIILDESFGALDPETMQLALNCVLKRAKTLVVIAHP